MNKKEEFFAEKYDLEEKNAGIIGPILFEFDLILQSKLIKIYNQLEQIKRKKV